MPPIAVWWDLMKQKLILLELNEVPFRILDDFCVRNPNSALARRLPSCAQFETYAEDHGHLSPWITWASLHRGVGNTQHTIADFGQDLNEIDRDFPPVWKLLARQGVRTGVCGSLHSFQSLPDAATAEREYAFYLPDTFAADSECFPKQLATFQEFNLSMVKASARNVSKRVDWSSALKLLASAPGLGLKPATMLDVGLQLVSERLKPVRRVRRRTYQAVLAFDIFMKQLRDTEPDFATVFTNHVASAMHRYWAARFPGDYETFTLSDDWVSSYRHEIEFAMQKLDRCFARLVAFVNRRPEYALWVTTSMGQAATSTEPIETELHLTHIGRFMETLGLPSNAWSRQPAMLPQANVKVVAAHTAAFREALADVTIAGRSVAVEERQGGLFVMSFGQINLRATLECATYRRQPIALAELGLENIHVEDRAGVTAYHIPQGSLLIYDPRRPARQSGRTQVSTLDLAPAILRTFDLPVPSYMRGAKKMLAA